MGTYHMKTIKVFSILLISFFFLYSFSYAASINKTEVVGSFVVNVILDNEPIKEIKNKVVIPFNSEYELLLKNNNNRKAVAKVTIDGANISSFGDIVIPVNGRIKLERFITDSLDTGKKFKLVPLNHPEVDDPSRKENGTIRVEFQLEKKREFITYDWENNTPIPFWLPILPSPEWENNLPFDNTELLTETTILTNTEISTLPGDTSIFVGDNYTVDCTPTNAELGATIGGSDSDQKFHKVDIDLEDDVFIIELKILGV